MISAQPTRQLLHEIDADGYIILCDEETSFAEHPELIGIENAFFKPVRTALGQHRFKGKADTVCTLVGSSGDKPVYLIFCGIGKPDAPLAKRREHLRRAMGHALRSAEKNNATNLAVHMPWTTWFPGLSITRITEDMLSSLELARYHFDQFITDASRHLPNDYTVAISAHEHDHDALTVGIERGLRIGYTVNQARHWCDLPADILTPTALADHAQAIANEYDTLACTIFDKATISELGMGGLYAVSQGSAQEPRFIIMEYTVDEQAPTVALVGKGVTFDSGGLGIKPAGAMEEMKDDKIGRAHV